MASKSFRTTRTSTARISNDLKKSIEEIAQQNDLSFARASKEVAIMLSQSKIKKTRRIEF